MSASENQIIVYQPRRTYTLAASWRRRQHPRNPWKFEKSTDITTFNAQYQKLAVRYNESFHDRFLIIDDKELYVIGASLKDLGRKCFAFTKIDAGEIRRIKKTVFAVGARTGKMV